MVETNAVAVKCSETNGLIDKLELSTGVFGAEDRKFLAKYQVQLAAGRTKVSNDIYFMNLFVKFWTMKANSKA